MRSPPGGRVHVSSFYINHGLQACPLLVQFVVFYIDTDVDGCFVIRGLWRTTVGYVEEVCEEEPAFEALVHPSSLSCIDCVSLVHSAAAAWRRKTAALLCISDGCRRCLF
jgi:hypothetical protein